MQPTLLITGAGGTIGRLLIDHFMQNTQYKIIALERAENAMAEILALYSEEPRVSTVLGDLLDPSSFRHVLPNCEAVIHCAALKHVLVGRHFPERQAYENVNGFCNILHAARDAGVKKFLLCSTDKAAQPTSVMGGTKHLLELVCRDAATSSFHTGVVRFANVLGSNGSLLQVLQNRLQDGADIVLRNPSMTRYFLRQAEAVELIVYAFDHLKNGEVFVRDTPAARIKDVMEMVLVHHGEPLTRIKIADTPLFEKIHERLFAEEELGTVRKQEKYFVLGAESGRKLNRDEQERALSSSAANISKTEIRELIYG